MIRPALVTLLITLANASDLMHLTSIISENTISYFQLLLSWSSDTCKRVSNSIASSRILSLYKQMKSSVWFSSPRLGATLKSPPRQEPKGN